MDDEIVVAIVVIIVMSIIGGTILVCCWCCSCCWLARRRARNRQMQQIIVVPAKPTTTTTTGSIPMAVNPPPSSQGYVVVPQSDPLPSPYMYPQAPPPYSEQAYSSTYPETYSKTPYASGNEASCSYQMSAPPMEQIQTQNLEKSQPIGTEEIKQILPEYSKSPAYNSTSSS